MVSIVAQMKHLMVDYREICKVKKTITSGSHPQNIFSKETLEVLQFQTDEVGFRMDHPLNVMLSLLKMSKIDQIHLRAVMLCMSKMSKMGKNIQTHFLS